MSILGIPQDEARMESNGRFVCLVCPQFPIVDTVLMLASHRQGKRHTLWDVEFKKRKLQFASQKFPTPNTSKLPSTASSSRKQFLGVKPYSAKSKKTGRKGNSKHSSASIDLSKVKTIRDFVELQRHQEAHEPLTIRPYGSSEAVIRSNISLPRVSHGELVTPNKQPVKSKAEASASPLTDCKGKDEEQKQLLVLDQTTKHYLEKYKNAKSSGWMKSKDGSWIRDPNAEFDSDDEAPDI